MKSKKWMSLLLVLSLTLMLIVGCSTAPTEPAKTPATNTPTEAPAEPADTPADTSVEEPEVVQPEEPADEPEETGFQWNPSETPRTKTAHYGALTLEIPDSGMTGTGGLQLPLAENEIISVYRYFSPRDSSIGEPNEVRAMQLVEERTGVHVDYTCYKSPEQFNIYLTSGDYADIIAENYTHYPGGLDKAIDDGVYVNGGDYLHLMPNFVGLMESDRSFISSATTDGGNTIFLNVSAGSAISYSATMVRADWLEKSNLDVPVTYDDWYNMLKVFQSEHGAKNPLYITNATNASLTGGYGVLAGGMSIQNSIVVKDGKLIYSPTTDNMRDYLTMMNKWWNEELIWRDFVSFTNIAIDDSQDVAWVENRAGAYSDMYYGCITFYKYMNPEAEMIAAPFPKLTEDSEINHVGTMGIYPVVDRSMFITTSAVDRGVDELCAKWIDYRYTEECSRFLYFGEENVTYTLDENGQPQFTEGFMTNTINGVTYEDANSAFCDATVPSSCFDIWHSTLQTMTPPTLEALAIWNNSADRAWELPQFLTLTAEESEEASRLYSDIGTYLQENIPQFVIGSRSMDTWDDFVNTINEMGIDDVIAIYEGAYARYLAR